MTCTLSVVTVNYHSASLIRGLESMLAEVPEWELVVVDNGGGFVPHSDRTRVVGDGSNLGFGRACNLGASFARGGTLLFLNPDVTTRAEDIRRLLGVGADASCTIWGPAILDATHRVPTLARPGRFGLKYRRRHVDLAGEPAGAPTPALYVSGACLMVSARFFESLGGFCDDIFLYAEDLELCARATRAGGQVLLYPQVRIEHAGGRSSSRFGARAKRLMRSWRGHYVFLSRDSGAVSAAINALHLASGLRI
jgi:N-acetylglucosaminyl-diphospho-decaprenol L-rhamnosyltransferase